MCCWMKSKTHLGGRRITVLYVCNETTAPRARLFDENFHRAHWLAECGVQTSYLDNARPAGPRTIAPSTSLLITEPITFYQWLRACQGKESVTIPDEVLRGVCQELAKNRVRVDDITSKKVRDALKVIKRKCYENVVLITSLLTVKNPRFSPTVEQTLQRLFMKIQKPFEVAVRAICQNAKTFFRTATFSPSCAGSFATASIRSGSPRSTVSKERTRYTNRTSCGATCVVNSSGDTTHLSKVFKKKKSILVFFFCCITNQPLARFRTADCSARF